MLTIHGVTRSRASRIIWLCHEIGLPFHQVPVIQAYRLADPDAPDAPLNTRSPSFQKLSLSGAIPVIEDDGLILTESYAILHYLAHKYGAPLGPLDTNEDALMMQWSFYAATAVEPDALTLLYLHASNKKKPSGEDLSMITYAAERLVRPFRVIESQLDQYAYLVGSRFTVADIAMAETLRYAQSYNPLMEQFPVIHQWLTEAQSRPAFQKMWQARLAEPE